MLKIETRLTYANIVVEGQDLKQKQFLEQLIMQIDPLFDVVGLKVLFVVSAGHANAKSDIEHLDRGIICILLETENQRKRNTIG